MFRATIPQIIIATRKVVRKQVKTEIVREGIVMKGLRQITQATEVPHLLQPQATVGQHQVVQQGQLRVAHLEVPLAHLEEDKLGFGLVVFWNIKNKEMKKIKVFVLIFSFLLTSSIVPAQSVGEIARYGYEQLHGSARYQAMGGAFGALGGDLSSISNNPAGSSVFAFNEAGATIGVQSFTTDANYLNGLSNVEKSSFDIGQAGFVLVLSNPSSKWDKIAFGFNTQTVNNFDKNLYAQGINYNRGLEDYFIENASGISYDKFDFNNYADDEYAFLGNRFGYAAQQAYMGLYTYTINHDDDNNIYIADGLVDGGIDQIHENNASGRQQLYTLNFSGRYLQKLSLGFNINIYAVDYAEYKATSDKYLDTTSRLDQVDLQQDLNTFGTGVSFQFGAIFKATDMLRFGASYTSPTYYELEDEYSEGLETYYLDSTGATQRAAIYPNIVNLNGPYKIKTAGKMQGSAALVLGKQGLLSVDYGKRTYGASSVTLPYAADSNALNNEITDVLEDATYLRIGGEGRIGDLSLRAGFWQEGSPYKNKDIIDNFSGYSLGLGVRFGSGSLDLAYTKSTQKYTQQLYYTGLTDSASINENMGQVVLTYNIRF